MSSKPFHFKRFSVAQNGSTHKVGTDGVLLGAWVEVTGQTKAVLDIGSGSGVIPLMLAQRTSVVSTIDSVEIEIESARQAAENVAQSPWPDKITIHQTAVQQFFPDKKYDLIVTNPPYFMNSWLPPEKKRRQARHTGSLSFDDVLDAATRLLNIDGRLALILPVVEALRFIELSKHRRLFLIRQTNFRTRIQKPIERLMLEFAFEPKPVTETELILYEEGELWSDAYKLLTRDFYLKS